MIDLLRPVVRLIRLLTPKTPVHCRGCRCCIFNWVMTFDGKGGPRFYICDNPASIYYQEIMDPDLPRLCDYHAELSPRERRAVDGDV